MSKGKNPNRSLYSQQNHERMVKCIAQDLTEQGFFVKADIENWETGEPIEINGFTPDITAEKDKIFLVFEVETCPTYKDELTKEQLTAFSKSKPTYIIIPPSCSCDRTTYDPIEDVKKVLVEWGLDSVSIGTCDPYTCKIEFK